MTIDKKLASTSNKLANRREELGLTLEQVGEIVGVEKSTVRKWEKGDIKNMRRDKIPLLAKALQVPIEFIMGVEKSTSLSLIPLLGTIRCGVPLLDESNYVERIKVPDNIKADFAARAEGDSMLYAGIQPGDIIFFKENQSPYNGQVVATRHASEEHGVNLKYFIQQNGKAFLRSANPDYEDIELNGHQQIIGVMVGLIRDGAPSLSDYKSLLAVKSDTDDRWTETIELAAAHGITPEAIQNMINMHVTMAFNLAKKR